VAGIDFVFFSLPRVTSPGIAEDCRAAVIKQVIAGAGAKILQPSFSELVVEGQIGQQSSVELDKSAAPRRSFLAEPGSSLAKQ
jgi:hypothetical protein